MANRPEAPKGAARLAVKAGFFAARVLNPLYFTALNGWPEGWRRYTDPDRLTGLLAGTILGTSIWYPQPGTGELTYQESASGAELVAFDFKRPQAFPRRRPQQLWEGRLYTFLIPEVADNPPDMLTPTSLFDLYNVDHYFTADKATALTAMAAGLITQTTLCEAYDTVGLSEQYADVLAAPGIGDSSVYQVTPKGNTLVRIEGDGGSREKRPDEASQSAPIGPRLGWAMSPTQGVAA